MRRKTKKQEQGDDEGMGAWTCSDLQQPLATCGSTYFDPNLFVFHIFSLFFPLPCPGCSPPYHGCIWAIPRIKKHFSFALIRSGYICTRIQPVSVSDTYRTWVQSQNSHIYASQEPALAQLVVTLAPTS